HRPLLLSVCALEPEYDLPLQINVLARVLERHPNAGLAILGAGSLESEVRARLASTTYSQHVRLFGDVPHAVCLQAIRQSDAVLRTTRYDGDAISVREALALDTPVIASDNGMRPDGVELYSMGDREALAAKICEVLERSPAPRRERRLDYS